MLPVVYKTVAFLRHSPEGDPHIDGFFSVAWPDGLEKGAIDAMCAIEEITQTEWLLKHGFKDAVTLVKVFDAMKLRARVNLMSGPYVFVTDGPLDKETALSVILNQRRRERDRENKGA